MAGVAARRGLPWALPWLDRPLLVHLRNNKPSTKPINVISCLLRRRKTTLPQRWYLSCVFGERLENTYEQMTPGNLYQPGGIAVEYSSLQTFCRCANIHQKTWRAQRHLRPPMPWVSVAYNYTFSVQPLHRHCPICTLTTLPLTTLR